MFGPYAAQPYALGSEGVNLEYTILSAILGNSNSPDSNGNTVASSSSTNAIQATTSFSTSSSGSNMVGQSWARSQFPSSAGSANYTPSAQAAYADSQGLAMPSSDLAPSSSLQPMSSDYIPSTSSSYTASYAPAGTQGPDVDAQSMQFGFGDYRSAPSAQSQFANNSAGYGRPRGLSASIGIPRSDKVMSSGGVTAWKGTSLASFSTGGDQSVYVSVTKPYDYTEGYHFLMKHLQRRYVRSRSYV